MYENSKCKKLNMNIYEKVIYDLEEHAISTIMLGPSKAPQQKFKYYDFMSGKVPKEFENEMKNL